MRHLKTYNESVRDMMRPKSREEVWKSFKKMTDKIDTPLTVYPMRIREELDEIIELLGEERKNLYFISWDDEDYHDLELMFESMIVENDQGDMKKINTDDGEWSCYPMVKLAYFNPYDIQDPSAWIFSKKHMRQELVSEGVRDKMTPKSEGDIKEIINNHRMSVYKKITFGLTNGFDWLVQQGLSEIPSLNDNQLKMLLVKLETSELYPRYVEDSVKKEMSKRGLTRGDSRWTPLDTIMLDEGVRDKMIPKSEGDIKKSLKNLSSDEKLIKGSKYGILWVVKDAVKDGSDVHINDESPLRTACYYGHKDVVEYLIEQGADIHTDNDISLRMSSENGHLDVVKCLVEHGANIHVRNDHPLRMASIFGYLDIVKYLVEQGADIHAKDDQPLQMAVGKGHTDVVDYLRQQMDLR